MIYSKLVKQTCPVCQREFELAGKGSGKKRFCSRRCLVQKTLNTCEHCRVEFRRYAKVCFCSRRCQTAERNKTFNVVDHWKKKYGDGWRQRYDEWRTKMSEVTSGENNGHFGHHHTAEAIERIAVRTRGKTLEEIYGHERAIDMRRRMSDAVTGENNPAFGKVYVNGGKSVKGHYKGKFFRSLLEYSFMKHLEKCGISLGSDVDYECFVIPYELLGTKRTYRIDFYVMSQHLAYEVKPAYALKSVSLINEAKWKAAREHLAARGVQFQVVSELDFPKIVFEIARHDADVVWKEETFKYFKGAK